MSPEEPSSSTPQSVASGRPALSRADVAIGNLSHQLISRTTSLPESRQAQSESPVLYPPVTNQYQNVQAENLPVPVEVQVRPAPISDSAVFQAKPQNQTPIMADVEDKQQASLSPLVAQKQKRLLLPALIVLAVLLAGGGLFGWLHWQSIQNNPTTIFSDALQASLRTTQLQTTTVSKNEKSVVDYDLTSPTNPLVSSRVTLNMFGSAFNVAGYGSAQNTYVSYTKFPQVISPTITSLATNGWVQLRSKGALPPGVNGTLSDVADPRYQAIGLLTFGNFPATTRSQLVNYLLSEHIYAYQPNDVSHTTLNGAKVLAYPVTLNTNFLKIYDQSVATDEGFSPSDVADAVNALGGWNGAQATFYVSADSHHFVQISLKQPTQTAVITYSNYNKNSLPGEPETKLTWTDFRPIQQMIDNQATATHTTAVLSAASKSGVAVSPHHG